MVARALISAGTESAQVAVADAIKSAENDWAAESRLIPALVGIKLPSPAIVACIENLAAHAKNPDVREMATMVSGALVVNFRSSRHRERKRSYCASMRI